MQKPKSLEQIANELAAKREPIKMEPKPKNTGGIDLSRAAGALNQQPKQQPKPNLAQKSRIPSQNLAQNSKIPSQNLAQQPRIPSQKPQLNSEQNSRNSRIPSQKPQPNSEQNSRNSKIPSQPQTASQPQSTQNSKIPSQNFTQKTRIQNLAQKPQPNSEQNTRNSRIPSQNLAQKPEPKIEPRIEPKPEPKDEKIVIKPKITTFRDDISALYETPAQNLSKTSLFIAIGIAFLVMIATLPKIFIANEIYYTSRDIGTLRDKLGVLNEENRELKSKLEQIRYQNQVIDNLR